MNMEPHRDERQRSPRRRKTSITCALAVVSASWVVVVVAVGGGCSADLDDFRSPPEPTPATQPGEPGDGDIDANAWERVDEPGTM